MALINEVFENYKITNTQTSILGAVANISGIVGSVIFSIIVDEVRAYKKVLIIINGLAIVFHFLMVVFIEIFTGYEFTVLLILWTCICICVVPIFTISMDFVCELTYPVGI